MSYYASDGEVLSWLPTPQAARKLQISESTLRRLRDRENGLISGTHYKRGLYKNTPCRWNVQAIELFIEQNAYCSPAERG